MEEKELSEIVEQFTKANAKQNETIMNFGFWFRRGKKGEKEVDLAKELLKQNNIDFNDTGKFGIDFDQKGYTIKKIKDLMLENKIVEYVIYHTE